MAPGAVGAGIIHVNLFVDMIIASFLATGAISALYYADRLFQLPLGVVGIAVGTALLPMLTKALSAGDTKEAHDLFNRSLEYCLILTVPAAVALMVSPHEIIGVLFQRGEFTAADTARTAPTLLCLAIGLAPFVAVKIFSSAYWARHDTLTPVKIAAAMAVLNIGLAIVLTRFLDVAGIALATAVSGWVQCYFLWRGLRHEEGMQFDARLKMASVKIVACSVLMGAVLAAVNMAMGDWFTGGSTGKKLIALMALVGGGGGVYFIAAQVSGLVRLQDVKKYLRRGV
jgi:putative peptidoglycan lipid II flippase